MTGRTLFGDQKFLNAEPGNDQVLVGAGDSVDHFLFCLRLCFCSLSTFGGAETVGVTVGVKIAVHKNTTGILKAILTPRSVSAVSTKQHNNKTEYQKSQ